MKWKLVRPTRHAHTESTASHLSVCFALLLFLFLFLRPSRLFAFQFALLFSSSSSSSFFFLSSRASIHNCLRPTRLTRWIEWKEFQMPASIFKSASGSHLTSVDMGNGISRPADRHSAVTGLSKNNRLLPIGLLSQQLARVNYSMLLLQDFSSQPPVHLKYPPAFDLTFMEGNWNLYRKLNVCIVFVP